MLNDKDVLMTQEHFKDLLRQAERDRLVHQALAQNRAQNRRTSMRRRAIAWVGSHFVAWGCYLQRRYTFRPLEADGAGSLDSTLAADCDCAS